MRAKRDHWPIRMKSLIGGILCVWLVWTPCWTRAESGRSLVNSGNELYTAGELDKALEAYEKALSEQPDAAEILFNKGNVLFRKGEFDKAREAYQAAALRTKEPGLEASAHYNLGNAVFEEGRKLLESDPRKALTQWGESVRHFQDALRVDPNLRDAAQNLEMVRISMKDLADRLKKAAEAAREQQKRREELQKKLEDVVREQESELAQNEELQKKAEQRPGESVDGEAQKLASEQERTREKTGDVAEQLKEFSASQPGQPSQKQPDESSQAAQEHLSKAREAQKAASDKLMKSDLEDARKDQEEAARWLKEALDSSKGQQGNESGQSDPKDGKQQAKEESGQQQSGSDNEAREGKENRDTAAQQQQAEEGKASSAKSRQGEKGEEQKPGAVFSESPDSILREEKDNRLQLHRAQQGGVKPVEKDW